MAISDVDMTREILRLLLQVAWADDELDDAEIEEVVGVARRGGLEESEVEALVTTLRGGQPLPPPDFGVLKTDAPRALQAARALVASDGEVSEDEAEILDQVASLLGIDG